MHSGGRIWIEVGAESQEEAGTTEEMLRAVGATGIEQSPVAGVLPLIPIFIGGVVGVTAISDLVNRWRQNHMCQQILEATKDGVKMTKDCSMRNGKIIVVVSDQRRVEIHDVPDGFDATKVVEALLRSDADAVKAAAETAGAKATDPKPGPPNPKPTIKGDDF
jgi:hypothetical protein